MGDANFSPPRSLTGGGGWQFPLCPTDIGTQPTSDQSSTPLTALEPRMDFLLQAIHGLIDGQKKAQAEMGKNILAVQKKNQKSFDISKRKIETMQTEDRKCPITDLFYSRPHL
ncbi:hypothetical protein HHI36_018110 [Cryptolaemus montrouzieri]|uniref:Uncharacterized protein n=1 Tax=Cryptolaemus montrouzieri TaxID=559131 RepID=A0ABD2NZ02_9CUCU